MAKKPAGNRSQLAPALTYYAVMPLFVQCPGGDICTVEDCSAGAFQSLIEAAAAAAPDPNATTAALMGLDYRYPLNRWYGLLAISEHGGRLPTFKTAAEARSAALSPETRKDRD